MEFPIVTTDALFVDVLNNACKNPIFVEAGTEAFGKQGEEFSNYRVETETHGVVVIYTAMPLERGTDGLPTKYLVTCALRTDISRTNYKPYNDTPL